MRQCAGEMRKTLDIPCQITVVSFTLYDVYIHVLQRAGMTLLKDDRFSAMFSNPDFQIDTESPEYKLLNPVVSKLDKAKKKKQQQMSKFTEILDDVCILLLYQISSD